MAQTQDPRTVTEAVALPPPVGPVSTLVAQLLAGAPTEVPARRIERLSTDVAAVADPLSDDDLQLALYLTYELHYRSFAGVDDEWEWHPSLMAVQALLEASFLGALRTALPDESVVDPARLGDQLFRMERDDRGPSLSRFVETQATADQLREFVIHRSLYQLKEADPHSWAIPRLTGPAKCALLEVQSDEYGGGRPDRIHALLFAKTMRALGLNDRENAYLEHVPGTTLATVNLMSALGLRRSRRGAIVGHLAMFEITSSLPNRRYANGLRRLGYDSEATDFYDEHVEADAVHENIAAFDLAGGLAQAEPRLASDILFGARALLLLEARFAAALLMAWKSGRTSLRSVVQDG